MTFRHFFFFCFFSVSVFLLLISCDPSKKNESSAPQKNEILKNDKAEPPMRICDWYGKFFPICNNITEGWGWENNESCIGITSCENSGGISLDFSKD